MAVRREGEFPIEGDRALADDGSVWTYETIADEQGGRLAWVQGEPWLSADELEAQEAQQADATARLSADHRVYAMAFNAVPIAKPENKLTENDPPGQFALALATAAMRDSVIEVATGTRSNLEAATLTRLRTFLGDPEVAGAQGELARLRRIVADDLAPESVTAKARGAVEALGEIAGRLPVDSDARNTINKILRGQRPQLELGDKLFRELATSTNDLALADAGLAAASAIAQAYG